MTAVASNAHTVQIVAAGGSVLANLISGLAADQWGTLTVANSVSLDPSGQSGDGWFSQSPRGEWDSLHDIARTWGACHGNAGTFQRQWMSGYVDANNSYITPIAIAGPNSQITHGFYGGPAIDQQTGDVYGAQAYIDNKNIRRYIYATGAQDTPFPTNNVIDAHCSGIAVAYHPGLYNGAGGIVTASNSGIWSSRLPRSGSVAWNFVLDRTSQVDAMDDFPVCTYNRKDGCVYVGGGGSSGPRKLWKIPASATQGTAIAVAYPPGLPLYEWTSNSSAAALVAAGDPAKSMVAMGNDAIIRAYNEVGDSWSTLAAVVPNGLVNSYNTWWNFIPCPKYKCILAMQGASNLQTSPTLYVFNH